MQNTKRQMKKIRDFKTKPVDADCLELTETKNYRRFLDKALTYADTICMTYNGDYQSFKKSEWAFLKNSITGHEITKITPVTKGPTVCLIYLRIDPTTTKWLKEKKHIYDFVTFDEWFDDLCFVKNGELVFASCTHEEFCEISKELRKIYDNDL